MGIGTLSDPFDIKKKSKEKLKETVKTTVNVTLDILGSAARDAARGTVEYAVENPVTVAGVFSVMGGVLYGTGILIGKGVADGSGMTIPIEAAKKLSLKKYPELE